MSELFQLLGCGVGGGWAGAGIGDRRIAQVGRNSVGSLFRIPTRVRAVVYYLNVSSPSTVLGCPLSRVVGGVQDLMPLGSV